MDGASPADAGAPGADAGEARRESSGPPRPSLKFPLAVFVVALAMLLASGDLGELERSLGSFPLSIVPLVLGLSLANYVLRMLRWHLYLRCIGIRAPLVSSATVFASGLAMCVTPGKAGELVKAYGMNRLTGAPVRRVVPVILMERVSDLEGVLLLAALGILSGSRLPLFLVGGALLAFRACLLWPSMGRALAARILDLPRLDRFRDRALDAFDALAALGTPLPLLFGTLVSVVSWGAEGAGLYVLVRGLGGPVSLGSAVMAYAIATLVGAVSFLPGGLIVTEGSMTGLLMAMDVSRADAALATTLCRVATLWFAVAIGCISLFWAWPRVARQHALATA